MTSRNIAVQQGIYDALVREKRRGESFTSVIRRLLDQVGALGSSQVLGVDRIKARGRPSNHSVGGRGGIGEGA